MHLACSPYSANTEIDSTFLINFLKNDPENIRYEKTIVAGTPTLKIYYKIPQNSREECISIPSPSQEFEQKIIGIINKIRQRIVK